jgi:hypothetical protein
MRGAQPAAWGAGGAFPPARLPSDAVSPDAAPREAWTALAGRGGRGGQAIQGYGVCGECGGYHHHMQPCGEQRAVPLGAGGAGAVPCSPRGAPGAGGSDWPAGAPGGSVWAHHNDSTFWWGGAGDCSSVSDQDPDAWLADVDLSGESIAGQGLQGSVLESSSGRSRDVGGAGESVDALHDSGRGGSSGFPSEVLSVSQLL